MYVLGGTSRVRVCVCVCRGQVQKIAELVRGLEPPPAAIAWNEIRRHTRPVVSDGNEPEKFVDKSLRFLTLFSVIRADYGV